MTTSCRLAKMLLAVLMTVTSLSLCLSIYSSMGNGTFHADYYYLPLREFVATGQQDAMETKVIELYDDKQRRLARLPIARDGLCLACLVIVRLLVSRIERGSETPKSHG